MIKRDNSSYRQPHEFDRAMVIANYFGFTPILPPTVNKKDLELTKHCANHPFYDAAEKAALIRTCLEQNLSSQNLPIALAYRRSAARKKSGSHSLHFIGTTSAIAEAALIRTALSILSEEGYKNLRVDLNCVGDRDSIHLYERELTNFVRRSENDFTDELRRSLKDDIFNIFRLEADGLTELRERAPSSITYLSPQSRIYFKEVLEFIESLGIEFRLSPELVGERNHVSHTIFAIKTFWENGSDTLAVGYRYSRLGRLLGLKKEIPMAGATIYFPENESCKIKVYKTLPKPKFFLIQMGREAKIKSLSILELLRSHRISVHHFLGRDKLSDQLSGAENMRVSHLIIVGQKEALDNTATVRNVLTREQDTVYISDLPNYLKKI